MISHEGGTKLVDFGIAKAANQVSTTERGVVRGKVAYMSPEQALGLELDPRSDIFSVCLVLLELVTGKKIFAADNILSLLHRVQTCEIPKATQLNPSVPTALEKILTSGLAKNRDDRYADIGTLQQALQRFLTVYYPGFTQKSLGEAMHSLFTNEKDRDAPEQELSLSLSEKEQLVYDLSNVELWHEDALAPAEESLREFSENEDPPPRFAVGTPGVGGRGLAAPAPMPAERLVSENVEPATAPPAKAEVPRAPAPPSDTWVVRAAVSADETADPVTPAAPARKVPSWVAEGAVALTLAAGMGIAWYAFRARPQAPVAVVIVDDAHPTRPIAVEPPAARVVRKPDPIAPSKAAQQPPSEEGDPASVYEAWLGETWKAGGDLSVVSRKLHEQAQKAYDERRYPAALEGFRKSRLVTPDYLPSWLYELRILSEIGKQAEAAAVARALVKARPEMKGLPVLRRHLAGSQP